MSEQPVIDCHTHLFWYPDHLSDQYAREALASKLVKLKRSGGLAYGANLNKHCYDAKPEEHWRVSHKVHKVVVFGLQAKASGIWVPNEIIAEYAAAHPDKVEGWASVDPTDPACVEQLEHGCFAGKELGRIEVLNPGDDLIGGGGGPLRCGGHLRYVPRRLLSGRHAGTGD